MESDCRYQNQYRERKGWIGTSLVDTAYTDIVRFQGIKLEKLDEKSFNTISFILQEKVYVCLKNKKVY